MKAKVLIAFKGCPDDSQKVRPFNPGDVIHGNLAAAMVDAGYAAAETDEPAGEKAEKKVTKKQSHKAAKKQKWCLIASGPSLTDADCHLIEKFRSSGRGRVMVVNNNWQKFEDYDVLYACDLAWWDKYHSEIKGTGQRITQNQTAARKYQIDYIKSEDKPGMSLNPEIIHQGGNSGYQAINLAYHLGATDIALLGYDMQHVSGQRHWHPDHPVGMNNAPRPELWLPKFNRLAVDCAAVGLKIINCSRQTALQCFDRTSIDAWLKDN